MPSPRRCVTPARRHGFSLLEILVVVVIIAVALSVVLPNVGRLPARLRGRLAAGAVRDALSQASLRARTTGETVTVQLAVDEERSRLILAGGGQGSGSNYVSDFSHLARNAHRSALAEKSGSAANQEWVLPEGVEWGDVPEEGFTFHANGEAGGPRLEFTVGRRRYVVDVERLTGRADVYEVGGD